MASLKACMQETLTIATTGALHSCSTLSMASLKAYMKERTTHYTKWLAMTGGTTPGPSGVEEVNLDWSVWQHGCGEVSMPLQAFSGGWPTTSYYFCTINHLYYGCICMLHMLLQAIIAIPRCWVSVLLVTYVVALVAYIKHIISNNYIYRANKKINKILNVLYAYRGSSLWMKLYSYACMHVHAVLLIRVTHLLFTVQCPVSTPPDPDTLEEIITNLRV